MNRVSLTLGLAAMDTCWVYPWCVLLGQWSGGTALVGPLTVFALVGVGAFTTQVLGRRLSGGRRGRWALASLSVVAATAAVRLDQFPSAGAIDWLGPFVVALATVIGQLSAPVFTFALGLYLWWRGVRIGSQT